MAKRTRSDCQPDHPIEKIWRKVLSNSAPAQGGCVEWTGRKLVTRGYGMVSAKSGGKWMSLYVHRVACEFANGTIPLGMQVDHRCHNRACVNVAHLRLLTPKQNNENRRGPNVTSTTGVLNVEWLPNLSRYRVRVQDRHVGYFGSLAEAKQAAVDTRASIYTHSDGR